MLYVSRQNVSVACGCEHKWSILPGISSFQIQSAAVNSNINVTVYCVFGGSFCPKGCVMNLRRSEEIKGIENQNKHVCYTKSHLLDFNLCLLFLCVLIFLKYWSKTSSVRRNTTHGHMQPFHEGVAHQPVSNTLVSNLTVTSGGERWESQLYWSTTVFLQNTKNIICLFEI